MADNNNHKNTTTTTRNTSSPLRGRGLRFILVDKLRQHQTLTVAEMAHMLNQHGYTINGRVSKVISDSLRWELARGRVKRLARGIYAYGQVPKTTNRRIKKFAHQCHAWIDATRRGQHPPETPPTPEHRKTYWKNRPEDPHRPPWNHLTWLWTT